MNLAACRKLGAVYSAEAVHAGCCIPAPQHQQHWVCKLIQLILILLSAACHRALLYVCTYSYVHVPFGVPPILKACIARVPPYCTIMNVSMHGVHLRRLKMHSYSLIYTQTVGCFELGRSSYRIRMSYRRIVLEMR